METKQQEETGIFVVPAQNWTERYNTYALGNVVIGQGTTSQTTHNGIPSTVLTLDETMDSNNAAKIINSTVNSGDMEQLVMPGGINPDVTGRLNLDADIKDDEAGNTVLKPKHPGMDRGRAVRAAASLRDAWEEGHDEKVTNNYLKGMGFKGGEIDKINAIARSIDDALGEGYSYEDIAAYLEVKPEIIESELPRTSPSVELKTLTIPEFVEAAAKLFPTEEYWLYPNNVAQVEANLKDLEEYVVNMGAGLGLELNLDKDSRRWLVKTPEGYRDVTPGWRESLESHKLEIGVGLWGGGIGALYGRALGAGLAHAIGKVGFLAAMPEEMLTVPFLSALFGRIGLSLSGSVVGAVGGSVAGANLDLMEQAMKLHEDASFKQHLVTSMEAFDEALFSEIVGAGLAYAAKPAWELLKVVKDVVLGVVRKQPTNRAYVALLKRHNMTEKDAVELVNRVKSMGFSLTGQTSQTRQIQAMMMTQNKGHYYMRQAGVGHEVAQLAVQRSRSIMDNIDKVVDKNSFRLFMEDVNLFKGETKQAFDNIKKTFTNNVKGKTAYTDIREIGIRPTIEYFAEHISDPAVRQKFVYQMESIEKMIVQGNPKMNLVVKTGPQPSSSVFVPDALDIDVKTGDGRKIAESHLASLHGQTFKEVKKPAVKQQNQVFINAENLMKLREIVNEWIYNKNITKHDSYDLLFKTREKIDDAISSVADEVLPNPDMWKKNFAEARIQHSEMKKLESSVLHNILFNPKNKISGLKNLEPKDVVSAFSDSVKSIDGTWERLMSQLPVNSRIMYENAVVDHIMKSHTSLTTGSNDKIINFVSLNQELNELKFTSKPANQLKKIVDVFSRVFQNDPNIGNLTHILKSADAQTYLTTNLWTRIKFIFASAAFNFVKQSFPVSKEYLDMAIINTVSRLMQNPVSEKAQKDFFKSNFAGGRFNNLANKMKEEYANNKIKFREEHAGSLIMNNAIDRGINESTIAFPEDVAMVSKQYNTSPDSPIFQTLLKKEGYVGQIKGSKNNVVMFE